MHDDYSVMIPGGLRLRSVQPVSDSDGTCPLLFDCERSLLLDVPDDLRHVAMALETGDLDEDLLGWLASEDLLTWERQDEPPPGAGPAYGAVGQVDGFGQVLFLGDRTHCNLTLDDEESALATLEAVLRRTGAAPFLSVQLDSEAPVERFELLGRLVAEAARWGRSSAGEVGFELRVAPAAVTPAVARLLAAHPFTVRVELGRVLGGVAPAALRGLARLHEALPERLTVHATLAEGDRLADLWTWASALGLRRLDATPLVRREAEGEDEVALERYRRDLQDLCEAIAGGLEAGRRPALFEPLARVVRRLAVGRPPGPVGGYGCIGLISHGEVLPVFGAAACAEPFAASRAEVAESAVRRVELEVGLHFFARLRDRELLAGMMRSDDPMMPFLELPLQAPPIELKTC